MHPDFNGPELRAEGVPQGRIPVNNDISPELSPYWLSLMAHARVPSPNRELPYNQAGASWLGVRSSTY